MLDITAYLNGFLDKVDQADTVKSEWVKVRESMIVHTRGVTPKKLLELNRPNEPDEVRQYRIANYRPITMDGINNAIDSLYRILSSSNYVIKPSEEISEYLSDKRFQIQDTGEVSEELRFKELILEQVLRIMIDDPNGYLVWMPINSEDSSLPPSQNPENSKIEIDPYIVDSPRIVDASEEVFSFSPREQWEVKRPKAGGKEYIEYHDYYFVITKEAIYRLTPYYSESEKKIAYRTELYYNLSYSMGEDGIFVDPAKQWDFLPCKVLGGNISMNENNQKYFTSFFNSYVPFGDEAISSFSDNQGVRVRYNFPLTSVKAEKCPTCNGTMTIQGEKDGKPAKVLCGTCNGTGTHVPFSPYGLHTRVEPSTNQSEAFALAPAYEFYNADVAILKESKSTWREFLEDAKTSLNMIFTKEAQSGVAKEIDREEKHDMLFKIAGNVFDLIRISLEIIDAYRNPFVQDRQQQMVKPPTSFAIKTEDDLTIELTEQIQKSSPTPYIVNTALELGKKKFNDDEAEQRKLQILTVWDVLFGKLDNDIVQLKAAGAIDSVDMKRHINGYYILTQLQEQIGDRFIDMPTTEIITRANALLQIEEQIPLVDGNGGVLTGEADISIGRLPLALQQMGLALNRAREAGNEPLSREIEKKMSELVNRINI